MGGELYHQRPAAGHREPLVLTIKFKSPSVNNSYRRHFRGDHIDLIAGEITGKIDPSSPDYTKATNDTTKVIATFTAADWHTDPDGYQVITYRIQDLDKSMYFRLRGTNLCGTPMKRPVPSTDPRNTATRWLIVTGHSKSGNRRCRGSLERPVVLQQPHLRLC